MCAAMDEESATPNTVPISATPMVEPIWRKKVALEVATPTWCGATAFWMASVNSGMEGPSPRPTRIIFSVSSPCVEAGRRVKAITPKATTATVCALRMSTL